MNWTMPYPWRSRRESVRRINMSSEPGSESFFCALRPIPRILSLPRRDYASQGPRTRDTETTRPQGQMDNSPTLRALAADGAKYLHRAFPSTRTRAPTVRVASVDGASDKTHALLNAPDQSIHALLTRWAPPSGKSPSRSHFRGN